LREKTHQETNLGRVGREKRGSRKGRREEGEGRRKEELTR